MKLHAKAAVAVDAATAAFTTITTLGIPTVTTTAVPTVAAATYTRDGSGRCRDRSGETQRMCLGGDRTRYGSGGLGRRGHLLDEGGSDRVGQAGEHTVGAEGDSGMDEGVVHWIHPLPHHTTTATVVIAALMANAVFAGDSALPAKAAFT